MQKLTVEVLDQVFDDLAGVGATVQSGTDDYGNPDITIKGRGQYPVLCRHSVIGGEEVVAISRSGSYYRVPAPDGDPFGPIDDASTEIEQLWEKVVATFPSAAVRG